MGLAVVARYSVLNEAQIARSTLESCGILAVVMDEAQGQMNYLWSVMLQGFRLCVIEEELEEARDILAEALREGAEAGPSDIPPNPRSGEWVVAGLVPGLLMPYFGLLVEATRRKPTAGRWAFLGVVWTMIAILLLFVIKSCSEPRVEYPGY